jgi:hypothetical protein
MKYVFRLIGYNIAGFGLYGMVSTVYMILAHNIPGLEYWEHDLFHLINWLAG